MTSTIDAGTTDTEARGPDPSDVDTNGAAWVDVCAFDDLTPDRGVCALVDTQAVAVFRCTPDDALFAVGNIDPFTDASVISRGLVGSTEIDGKVVRFVASPLRKQRFDLAGGAALDVAGVGLDGAGVGLGAWSARCRDGRVEVQTKTA